VSPATEAAHSSATVRHATHASATTATATAAAAEAAAPGVSQWPTRQQTQQ
jgi:hypothetical protein